MPHARVAGGSGPDVLALPREFAILEPIFAEVRAESDNASASTTTTARSRFSRGLLRGPLPSSAVQSEFGADAGTAAVAAQRTALLFDLFRISKNDPLSYAETRYNMGALSPCISLYLLCI